MKPRRAFEFRGPAASVSCGECGTVHEAASCPCCGEQPEGAWVGVLRTEVVTDSGQRWFVTAERDAESAGWEPVAREPSSVAWGGEAR